jgi:hypothetical protein
LSHRIGIDRVLGTAQRGEVKCFSIHTIKNPISRALITRELIREWA